MKKIQLNEEFIQELTEVQPRLYGYIFKRFLNPEETREVLQETNLVLCRKHGDFQIGTSFPAWSFQTAHYQILAFRQKKRRERLLFDEDVLESLSLEETPEEADHLERLQALEACLHKLPANHRRLIAARYESHGNVKAVASQLGKSPNAISKLLQRTRIALLNCIEEKLEAIST